MNYGTPFNAKYGRYGMPCNGLLHICMQRALTDPWGMEFRAKKSVIFIVFARIAKASDLFLISSDDRSLSRLFCLWSLVLILSVAFVGYGSDCMDRWIRLLWSWDGIDRTGIGWIRTVWIIQATNFLVFWGVGFVSWSGLETLDLLVIGFNLIYWVWVELNLGLGLTWIIFLVRVGLNLVVCFELELLVGVCWILV